MCENTGWSQGMQDEVWYFWGCQHLRQSCLWAVSSAPVLPWHLWAPALSFTPTHSQSQTHTHSSYLGKRKRLTLQTEKERETERKEKISPKQLNIFYWVLMGFLDNVEFPLIRNWYGHKKLDFSLTAHPVCMLKHLGSSLWCVMRMIWQFK